MSCTFISHVKDALNGMADAKDKALEIIGGKAESYAKRLCPVDTGRLRNSITHQQLDENTEVIGSNVEYAPFVELSHHTASGTLVPGQPFLRPAAENHTGEYKRIIEQVMKNG